MPGEFRPSLPGERRGGRQRGTPNKADATIKDMVIKALQHVGGAHYLAEQAHANPVAFMGLVGRVLPLQLAGHDGEKLQVEFSWRSDDAADAKPYRAVPSLGSPGPNEPIPAAQTIDGNAVDVESDDDTPQITFLGEC